MRVRVNIVLMWSLVMPWQDSDLGYKREYLVDIHVIVAAIEFQTYNLPIE